MDTVVWIVLGDLVSSACMRFMLAGFGWWAGGLFVVV